jgi:hypothetical protein
VVPRRARLLVGTVSAIADWSASWWWRGSSSYRGTHHPADPAELAAWWRDPGGACLGFFYLMDYHEASPSSSSSVCACSAR